jgi:hypothetical protein
MRTKLRSSEQPEEDVMAITEMNGTLKLLIPSGWSALMPFKVRCGRMQQDETEFRFADVVRKQLGLTLSGESRDNFLITGYICLEGVDLERVSLI